jgi:hypothetical protein
MTEEQFQQIINARISNLFDLYPIDDLRPIEVNEEMKDGLSRAYAHKGMRNYLENATKIALKNMAIATTPVEIAYYKSRIDVLEQLLAKGKQLFNTTKDTNAAQKR